MKDKKEEKHLDELVELRRRVTELERLENKRKRMESKLKELEKKYKSIFELTLDGIVTVDLKGVVTSCNKTFLRLTGYSSDEIINKHFTELPSLLKKDIPKYTRILKSLIKGKIPKPFEAFWIHKNGTTRVVEVLVSLMKTGRRITGIQAIARDITERKRFEESLMKSEEKYRNLVENANDGIVIIQDKLLKYANSRLRDISGYHIEELIDTPFTDYVHPDELPKMMDYYKRRMAGEEAPSKYELIVKDKKGQKVFVEINASIIDYQGRPADLVMIRDITDRKQIENALKESEERYRLLVENQTDLVVKLDTEGRFLFVSPSYCQLFGKEEEELSGKKFMPLVHEDDRETTAKAMKNLYRPPYTCYVEQRAMTKDGWKWLGWADKSVVDEKGNVVAVVGVGRDITPRKETEEEKERLQVQLIHSEKMAGIGTLAGGITHEFNNLLQITRGHAEFAQKTKKVKDMEEALDIVINTSDRVAKVIEDLLTFSKVEVAKEEFVNIVKVIESVLSLIEDQLKKRNIRVVRNYDNIPQIKANKEEMKQVFLNMITNARDAILPEGGRLAIGIKQIERNIEMSFTDTGKGIKKENLSKIFEPFYTTKKPAEKDSPLQGTGLGLTVSYGIIKRHKGEIEVESEEGKGTTFTILLPY